MYDAERRYDFPTAIDLHYHALLDLCNQLELLERKDAGAGGEGSDVVTPEQVSEIVIRWMSTPVARFTSSKMVKSLRLEEVPEESIVSEVKAVANAVRLSHSSRQVLQVPGIQSFPRRFAMALFDLLTYHNSQDGFGTLREMLHSTPHWYSPGLCGSWFRR